MCPLVEESEALQARAATAEAERLAGTEFRAHRVELIHGQMGARRKAEAMRAFAPIIVDAGPEDLDRLFAPSVSSLVFYGYHHLRSWSLRPSE